MRKTLVAISAALSLTLSALGALAQAPAGSVGIRLLEVPTNLASDPRAHLYIIDHVPPGTRLSRRIEVSNGTKRRLTIQLYTAGAEISGGTFQFDEGRKQNEVSSWTSVSPRSVTIQAGGAADATVRIVVPADASGGERYAVVWAQLPASTSPGAVTAVNRVGIRIYLSVGPGGAPPSDFEIVSLRAARTTKGQPQVDASVRNTGGRALDMSGDLRLTDGPGGLSAGPYRAELGTTLGIGQTEDVHVLLDPRIPAGPWRAHLTLRSGLLTRSASATITFPAAFGAAGSAVPAVADRARNILLPLGGALLLLLLIAFGLFFLAKRRRDEEQHETAAARAR